VPRNDLLPTLDLQNIPIEDLKMPARIVRELDPGHIEEVANGIQAMGFSAPVLVGKDSVIIEGVTSVKAAEELGLVEVPA
jgi:ParB-like chromosome segregation protein Spo0J